MSPKGPHFTILGIVGFFKIIIFRLKFKFSQHALSEFCFLRPAFLPCDFFLICFYQSPPEFLLETKRFASIQDYSRFFSIFVLLGLQWGKSGFRVLCVSLVVFFDTVKFMKF